MGELESDCPKSAALVRGISAEGVADSLCVHIFSLDAMFLRVMGLCRQYQELPGTGRQGERRFWVPVPVNLHVG